MKAVVSSVIIKGILQLNVKIQIDAFAKALAVPGQTAIREQHLTLVRLDDLGISVEDDVVLLAPPQAIDLDEQVYMVKAGDKQSCYLVATAEMQKVLRRYTMQCLSTLGLASEVLDLNRIYHVTVTNGGDGQVRASVGAPWEFASILL